MVSLPDDRLQPQGTGSTDHTGTNNLSIDWVERADREQMFQLIDSILPFEVCLYHQVLPLSVEGSRLNLGMVDPQDRAALDYIRRLVSYINCSIAPRKIQSEALQTLLSAYLNYSQQKKQKPLLHSGNSDRPPSANYRSPETISGDHLPSTLIVDSPEEINPGDADFQLAHWTPPRRSSDQRADPNADPAATNVGNTQNETLLLDQTAIQPAGLSTSATFPQIPTLEVLANHLNSPIEVLAMLPPKHLMHELLGRVLAGGIGRLFFERQAEQGRILWSQDGILQSVLENLATPIFQGVINELKQITDLPMLTVQKPRQVEIERLYQGERLLLRFRVMPGTHGEEATLQVLRGAALKFHQQQQLATLGRDALGIAQQLQRKLSEIRERAVIEKIPVGAQLEALEALNQILQTMKQQISDLSAIKEGGDQAR